MKILLSSEQSAHDRDMFFRAQILFWLLGAIDGHAKNFSIFIKENGRFEMAPLYDIMSAFPLIENKQLSARKIKMAMALRGKNNHYNWYGCKRSYFTDSAKYCGYSVRSAENLLEQLLMSVDDVINSVSNQLPKDFNFKLAASIFENMIKMKQLLTK